MLSMATVATRPRASLRAEMEPAMSIWDSSQPPKMSPLALVSLGMATVCRASSPLGTGASSWSSSWLMVSSPAVTSRRPIRGGGNHRKTATHHTPSGVLLRSGTRLASGGRGTRLQQPRQPGGQLGPDPHGAQQGQLEGNEGHHSTEEVRGLYPRVSVAEQLEEREANGRVQEGGTVVQDTRDVLM